MDLYLLLILTVHKLLINCKILKLETIKMIILSKGLNSFWNRNKPIRFYKEGTVFLIILISQNILILSKLSLLKFTKI